MKGWASYFSSRNHHLASNPKLRTTSCQACACILMCAIHRLIMASNYWQLALDVQTES
jgi:hypothetical protein